MTIEFLSTYCQYKFYEQHDLGQLNRYFFQQICQNQQLSLKQSFLSQVFQHFFKSKKSMELQYQSDKESNLSCDFRKIDQRYGSIILSTPYLPSQKKTIPNSLKKTIRGYIIKDQCDELLTTYKEKKFSLTDEISKKGLEWNSLHYMAKHNACKCLQYCLKTAFQQNPKQYHRTIQSKTIDEQTPLIVAFHHKSNQVIRVLLDFGGIDIYAMNIKKMTAYEIAEANYNEEGLGMLMKYQLKIKEKDYLNITSLNQPISISSKNFFKKCFICLSYCLREKETVELKNQSETNRDLRTNQPLQELGIYQIQWRKPNFAQVPLFSEKINPFHIRQNSVIVSNLLFIFQCFAKFPQILRKKISQVGQRYYVEFFSFIRGDKIIWVDNTFPFLNHTEQPLFLSLEGQLWPMVLQKALCQYYFGYFEPGKIPLQKIIESISSSSTYLLKVPEKQVEYFKLINFLRKLQDQDCIYLLNSRQSCPLRSKQGRKQCFSVLKVSENKILINCAFVTNEEKVRQFDENIEMKMTKVHYRNPSTMALWITIEEFHFFFEQIIFCQTVPIFLPIKNSFYVYLTDNKLYLQIKLVKERKNRIFLTLKDKLNFSSLMAIEVNGWAKNSKNLVKRVNCEILGDIMIEQLFEQILLQVNILKGEGEEVLVRSQSDCPLKIQSLDGFIGELTYIQYCKNYYKNVISQQPIIQRIGDYVLIIATIKEPCAICFQGSIREESIVEGILTGNNSKIVMLKHEGIQFIVVTHLSSQEIQMIKIQKL